MSLFSLIYFLFKNSLCKNWAWSWVCRVLRSTFTWPRCSSRLWPTILFPGLLATKSLGRKRTQTASPPCCCRGSSLWPVPWYPWVSTTLFQLPSWSFPKHGSQSGLSQLPRGCENLKAPPNLSSTLSPPLFPSRSHIPPHHDGRDRKGCLIGSMNCLFMYMGATHSTQWVGVNVEESWGGKIRP